MMDKDIRIRSYRPEHRNGVADLITGIQQGEFGIRITLEDQPDLKHIPSFYQAGAGNFWVAEFRGRVVGTISLLDIGGRQGALRKMFVAKDFRGDRTGTARSLLTALLSHARQNGIEQIFLGTTPKFLAAHRFYEKNGFLEVKKSVLPQSFPVMAVDTKFYSILVEQPQETSEIITEPGQTHLRGRPQDALRRCRFSPPPP